MADPLFNFFRPKSQREFETQASSVIAVRRVRPWPWPAQLALTVTGSAVTLLWFALLGVHLPLGDEAARTMAVAREMLESGEFLVPHLNGSSLAEAPLPYWATLASFRMLGVSDLALRLPGALFGYLTLIVVLVTARHLWDLWSSAKAGLWLCASPLFLWFTQQGGAAPIGCFWLTLSICAFAIGQNVRRTKSARLPMAIAWGALAAAMLSIGFAGLLIPLCALVGYVLWQRDFEALLRLRFRMGAVLVALLTLPWFVAAAMRDGTFLNAYLHRELDVFLAPPDNVAALKYLMVLPLLAILPFLPEAMRVGWRVIASPVRHDEFDARRLLLACALTSLCFFAGTLAKSPGEMLPLISSLALVCAAPCQPQVQWPLRFGALIALFTGLGVLVFLSGAALDAADAWVRLIAATGGTLKWVVVLLMLSGLAAMVLLGSGAKRQATTLIGLGWFGAIVIALSCAERFSNYYR